MRLAHDNDVVNPGLVPLGSAIRGAICGIAERLCGEAQYSERLEYTVSAIVSGGALTINCEVHDADVFEPSHRQMGLRWR